MSSDNQAIWMAMQELRIQSFRTRVEGREKVELSHDTATLLLNALERAYGGSTPDGIK